MSVIPITKELDDKNDSSYATLKQDPSDGE